MSDEIKVEEKQEEVKETVQVSEHEERALEQGWLPKDQWQGDPEEWVSARQFIKNGELFGRINTYKHKITGLEKSVEALVKHNEKVFDAGYKAAESQLKAQRREALAAGDVDAVEKIEERLDEIKTEHVEQKKEFKEQVQPQKANDMHPAWEPWIETNSWYGQSPAMRGYADEIARDIVTEAKEADKQVDFTKLLGEVSRKVKQRFPEKFGRSQSQVGSSVKDDGPSVVKNKKDDVESQMTSDEKEIMEVILRTGVKKADYLDQYKKVQQRKGR